MEIVVGILNEWMNEWKHTNQKSTNRCNQVARTQDSKWNIKEPESRKDNTQSRFFLQRIHTYSSRTLSLYIYTASLGFGLPRIILCVCGAIEKQNTLLRVCLFVVLLYISWACTFFELIKCIFRVAFVLKQSKRSYNAGVIPEMIAVQLIYMHTKTIMTKSVRIYAPFVPFCTFFLW